MSDVLIDIGGEAKKQVSELIDELLKAVDTVKMFNSEFKRVKVPSDADKAIKKTTESIKTQNKAINEAEKLTKRLEATRQKAALATSKENQELIKLRLETNKTNKETRDSIKLNTSLADSYEKLRIRLSQAEKEYRDLAASQGLNSKATLNAQKNVQKLRGQVDAINEPIKRFSDNVGNYPKSLGGGIKAIASLGKSLIGVFGIVEGLRLVFNFAVEARQLAVEAKGVEFAFDRIGQRGTKAFEDIKKATRGTLSDLDIKTSINEFENFNILTEDAGILFEFLSVRAAQTGKSVDKLRDSLVEGLSKESKLRIDNLGISAAELNEELERTPDFVQAVANIARREVAEAGNILDEAASGQAKWAAQVENTKLAFGQLLGEIGDGGALGFFAGLLERLSSVIRTVSEGIRVFQVGISNLLEKFPALNKAVKFIGDLLQNSFAKRLEFVGQAFKAIGGVIGGFANALGAIKNSVIDFISALTRLTDIDFSSPSAFFGSIKDNFKDVFSTVSIGAGNISDAFKKGFEETVAPIEKTTEALEDQKDTVTELTEEEKKLAAQRAKRAADAQQTLDEFRVKQQIEDAKKVAEAEEESTQTRLNALDDVIERTEALIRIRKNAAISEAENDPERELAEAQAAAELIKLDEETERIRTEIQRSAINERKQLIIDGVTQISNEIIKQRDAELIANEEIFKSGLITQEQFEQERLNITAEFGRQQLEQQLAFLAAELLNTQKTAEEKIAIEQQLSAVRTQLRELDLNEFIRNQDSQVDKTEQATEILKGQFAGLAESLGVPADAFNGIFEGIQTGFEDVGAAADAFGSLAIGVFDQITAADNARLERRLENIAKERDIAIQFAGDNVAAQEAINAQFAAKEAEIRRKQAQNEKKNALFQIGVNTAQAIIKTAAQLGFPAAIPFVAAVGAIGAAQAAIVATQPLPEFAEGVRGFEGGPAIVGDGGKREPITDKRGKLIGISPSRSTLVNLPKGANVYSSIAEYKHEKGLNDLLSSNGINPMGGAIFNGGIPNIKIQNNGITEDQMYRAVKKAVGKQSTFNVNIDKKGVQSYLTNGGKRTTNFLNNRVSGKGKNV